MSNETIELLSKNDFVSVYCEVNSPLEVNYSIRGVGEELEKISVREMELTDGVDGTFDFTMYGKIAYPDTWASFSCKLEVNALGSVFSMDNVSSGYLGYGSQRERSLILSIYVKPSIAKNIVEKILIYDPASDINKISFRADLVNFKNHDDGIGFQIVRAYF